VRRAYLVVREACVECVRELGRVDCVKALRPHQPCPSALMKGPHTHVRRTLTPAFCMLESVKSMSCSVVSIGSQYEFAP
jgi:hypothetical protein